MKETTLVAETFEKALAEACQPIEDRRKQLREQRLGEIQHQEELKRDINLELHRLVKGEAGLLAVEGGSFDNYLLLQDRLKHSERMLTVIDDIGRILTSRSSQFNAHRPCVKKVEACQVKADRIAVALRRPHPHKHDDLITGLRARMNDIRTEADGMLREMEHVAMPVKAMKAACNKAIKQAWESYEDVAENEALAVVA